MAAGRNLNAKFILSLRDNVSTGLMALKRRLDGMAGTARRIGLLGAVAGAASFAGPIASAAQYQDTLLQTQITAGGVGTAAMAAAAEAGRAYERLALETGQRSRDLAGAAQNLVAAGLDPARVRAFLPVLARAATATGASLDDLSRMTVAFNQNLKIDTAQELADTLGSVAQAGKAGMFELRDMARYFPQLTAAWRGVIDTANQAAAAAGRVSRLSTSGREAAASMAAFLQVARRGAATSEEAANNAANFLQKLTNPETLRNFREHLRVDLEAVFADAAAKGVNPIEAVIEKLRERTGGNMFRVGEIFGDKQVLDFLRPVLGGTGEYLDTLRGALAANEALLNQDFATRMAGTQLRLTIVMERSEQIMRRIGLAAAGNLGIVDRFLALVERGMGWMDAHYPGVIDSTLKWVVGISLLTGALGLLAPVLGFIGVGLGMLVSPLGLVAMAASAVAVLGLNIWENWGTIGPRLMRLVEQVRDVFVGAARLIGSAWDSVAGSVRGLLDHLVPPPGAPIWRLIDYLSGITGSRAAPAESGPPAERTGEARRFGQRGAALGFYAPEATMAGGGAGGEWQGTLRVELDRGLVLRGAHTDRRDVQIEGPRGPVLGRD